MFAIVCCYREPRVKIPQGCWSLRLSVCQKNGNVLKSYNQTDKYILPFWNNPNMETLNNLLEQFDDVRKDYKDYILDYNTIIEQVLRFKSLFSN